MWWLLFSSPTDLPPTKRRRGLAGSIVSTAWSAALMGTAVGLTVYRLWRDRGRHPDEDAFDPSEGAHTRKRRVSAAVVDPDVMSISRPPSEPPSPPPPYNQEWTAIDYPQHYPHSRATLSVPTTPRGREKVKPKATPRSTRKTGSIRAHQGQKTRKAAPFVRTVPGAASTRHHDNPDSFDFNMNQSNSASGRRTRAGGNSNNSNKDDEEDLDVEEQMDWIGGKLAQLIEDGKRALGTEVVVMSDAKEDEVDDGSGAWVSDDEDDIDIDLDAA
ncbi:hypothetical protein MD484_g3298, partial [Candolleomyces efflorescens]